jgi:ketosteroid isomerase-like protein
MRRSDTGGVRERTRARCLAFDRGLAAALLVLFATILIAATMQGSAMAADPSDSGRSAVALDPSAELLNADTDFDKAVAEKGVDAWVFAFAEDGIMFRTGEIVRGHAAIRELMAPAFDTPGFSLRWKPVRADIATSGDLGYTYGTYESISPGPDGKPATRTGMYVTIWKRQADGSWKVVVDLGSASPPPPPKSTD